jgi:monoamine oxidase
MVIIIGGGLSGLLTAFRLKQANIDFKILEAKDQIGGRIFTKTTDHETPIEMGATWFGRQHHSLIKLLNELELTAFPQFQGDYYFYDDINSSHHGKYKLPQQEPSYRISGGSKTLIEKLAGQLEQDQIQINTRITQIRQEKDELIIHTDKEQEFLATEVVLALPPKIWAHQISFQPSLPQELEQTSGNTQTWMEDSIKAAVEFKEPFWRRNDHPETIMSNFGPFIECYDHSNQQESKFALCGFLNPEFKKLDNAKREAEVLKQLSAILGEEVQNAISYHEYIWSDDDLVKWPKNTFMQPHQNNGHPIFRESYYEQRLIISGSESASTFPGYMDGAVEAGEYAFEIISKKMKQSKINK